MYYLLENNEIVDSSKWTINGGLFIEDGELKIIHHLGLNTKKVFGKVIKKSENILDLAVADDEVEDSKGARLQIKDFRTRHFVNQPDVTDKLFYGWFQNAMYEEDVVALWKRQGNIMKRYEVKVNEKSNNL